MENFTDYILAAAGQTYFATSEEYVPNALNVYKNGLKLIPTVQVNISYGTYFTLITPTNLNDQIIATGPSANAYTSNTNSNTTFFSRLGFDFDTKKFGEALTVNGLAESFYKNNPIKLRDWQKNILKGKSYDNFFQNPVSGKSEEIKNQLIKIRDVMCEVIAANTTRVPTANIPPAKANSYYLNICTTAANASISSLQLFKTHTDRISGVTVSTTDDPDYDKAISIGTTIAQYANAIDGIKDFSPILGSFTSLFISDDLESIRISIATLKTSSGTLIDPSQWSNTNYYNSGILSFSPQDAANLANTTILLTNIVDTRRNHDKNYYLNSFKVMLDQNKITQLVSIPNPAAIVLIRDFIGTDELKKLL